MQKAVIFIYSNVLYPIVMRKFEKNRKWLLNNVGNFFGGYLKEITILWL